MLADVGGLRELKKFHELSVMGYLCRSLPLTRVRQWMDEVFTRHYTRGCQSVT